MTSQDKIHKAKEAYTQLYYEFKRVHDFKIGRLFYWFGANQAVGTMFDPADQSISLWRANLQEQIFDTWHDGQFVWDDFKFKEYKKIISNLADKELLE